MFLSIVISVLLTQAQQGTAQLRGFRTAPALFQQNCGTCHGKEGSLSMFLGSGYGTGNSINGNALLAFGPD